MTKSSLAPSFLYLNAVTERALEVTQCRCCNVKEQILIYTQIMEEVLFCPKRVTNKYSPNPFWAFLRNDDIFEQFNREVVQGASSSFNSFRNLRHENMHVRCLYFVPTGEMFSFFLTEHTCEMGKNQYLITGRT